MRVLVAGHQGKMGTIAVKAICEEGFQVVGVGADDDLLNTIKDKRPDVMVDLTTPDCVEAHTICAIEQRIPIVVGTTGLDQTKINNLVLSIF